MPNHVDNTVTVVGPAEDIARFVEQAAGKAPRTGDRKGSINYLKDRPVQAFSFHALIPLPALYHKVPYDNRNGPSGYQMEYDTWGVKWGAYNVTGPTVEPVTTRGIDAATYKFTTAWQSPYKFIEKLSALWPNCHFYVSYQGEGPVAGRYSYFQGDYTETAEVETWPEYPGKYGDEKYDEWHEKVYEAARSFYVDQHDEWWWDHDRSSYYE